MNIICFHDPNEDYGYLSNWYKSDFSLDGITYSSMEQYMMYQKAITFHDNSIAKDILATDDVGKIKSLGRTVSNYNNTVWNGIRQIVVFRGLCAKFSQNDSLKKELLATGNAILAEAAKTDLIWGIGIPMTDDDRNNVKKWKGQNLLGFALMQVRDKLKKEHNTN